MRKEIKDVVTKKYKVVARKEGKRLPKTAVIEARSKYERKQKAFRLFPDYDTFEFIEIGE